MQDIPTAVSPPPQIHSSSYLQLHSYHLGSLLTTDLFGFVYFYVTLISENNRIILYLEFKVSKRKICPELHRESDRKSSHGCSSQLCLCLRTSIWDRGCSNVSPYTGMALNPSLATHEEHFYFHWSDRSYVLRPRKVVSKYYLNATKHPRYLTHISLSIIKTSVSKLPTPGEPATPTRHHTGLNGAPKLLWLCAARIEY